jgi:polyferredoxin
LDKIKRQGRIRKTVQVIWAFLTNAHLAGFIKGSLYEGPLKNFCVPGMNCYSCPGAVGACPIGALQSAFTGRKPRFPFYVLGFLLGIGVLVGRFICGWLCLFGLIQELLYKIPVKKINISEKWDRRLRKLKYAVLGILVILLPIILRDEMGLSVPYFCKWLCPVGTLEAGVPLMLLNKGLRAAAHFVFVWKLGLLVLILLSAVFIHRPFCKYLCPLGAFYALFQRISLLRLKLDTDKCVSCGTCSAVCPMQVDPSKTPNHTECIRCGKCTAACPQAALKFHFGTGSASREGRS